VAYEMALLPIPLNDLEGPLLLFETFLALIAPEMQHEFTNSASRGHSAVAELLVLSNVHILEACIWC